MREPVNDKSAVDVAVDQTRLLLALEAGRLGTWDYDLVSGAVHWSPDVARMHGIAEGSFDGTFESHVRHIHPDDRERVLHQIEHSVREGAASRLLYRIVRPDGETRWLESSGAFVGDKDGKPERLVGVCSDATDRIEQQMSRESVLMHTVINSISDSLSIIDPAWRVLFANAASAAQLGLEPIDIIGKSVLQLMPDIAGTPFQAELSRVMNTGIATVFEEHYAPFDRWFEVSIQPIAGLGVISHSRDVTARHNERILQERMARYGALQGAVGQALSVVQALPSMLQECCEAIVQQLSMSFARVWLLDPSGVYLDLSASAGKYTHIDGGHARVRVGDFKIGKIASERTPHLTNDVQHDPRVGDPEWARREGMVAFAGYPLLVHDRLVGVMAAFATAPLHADTLTALGGIANTIAQGIERRRAEVALEETARSLTRSNAELEQFAYVASHDLQEPLRMVASYVQLLERRYRDKLDDDARDFINYAVEGVTRMRRLIEDLLAYSRVGTRDIELEPVQLDEVLTVVQQNLKQVIEESSAVVSHDPLPSVVADQSQLVQLLQNLVGNAIKFRGNEPPRVHIGVKREHACWVFTVRDNGIGIEAQYFDRVFVIFQRLNTREQYPGTGIGLAIAKKIVERHGGRIDIESAVGEGTTIAFSLPVEARTRRSTQ